MGVRENKWTDEGQDDDEDELGADLAALIRGFRQAIDDLVDSEPACCTEERLRRVLGRQQPDQPS